MVKNIWICLIWTILIFGCRTNHLNHEEAQKAEIRLQQSASMLKHNINASVTAMQDWLTDKTTKQDAWHALDLLLGVISDAIKSKRLQVSQLKKQSGYCSHFNAHTQEIVLAKKDVFYAFFTLIHESYHYLKNPGNFPHYKGLCKRCEYNQSHCFVSEVEAEIAVNTVFKVISKLCGEPLFDDKTYWRYPIECWPTLKRIWQAKSFQAEFYLLEELEKCRTVESLKAWLLKNATQSEKSNQQVLDYLYIAITQLLICTHYPNNKAMDFINDASATEVHKLVERLLNRHPLDIWIDKYEIKQRQFFESL